MTASRSPQCETCGLSMSRGEAVVKVVGGVIYIACLGCVLENLEDDDSVFVSVWMLRGLKNGTMPERGCR